jgi:hypothetical protein
VKTLTRSPRQVSVSYRHNAVHIGRRFAFSQGFFSFLGICVAVEAVCYAVLAGIYPNRHCEERCDEAISLMGSKAKDPWDLLPDIMGRFLGLRPRNDNKG